MKKKLQQLSQYLSISDHVYITINTSGVEKPLRILDPHKASSPDVIPAHLLCELSAELAPALSFVSQVSFDTGQIPGDW